MRPCEAKQIPIFLNRCMTYKAVIDPFPSRDDCVFQGNENPHWFTIFYRLCDCISCPRLESNQRFSVKIYLYFIITDYLWENNCLISHCFHYFCPYGQT